MKITDCQEKIYKVVRKIPRGKVTTYGTIAKYLDLPTPRMVGKALHNNPYPAHIPCHRVVNFEGRLSKSFAFGGTREQKERLEQEKVHTEQNRVDLKIYGWKPDYFPR